MVDEEEVIERTVTVKDVDPEACDVLGGILDRDGACRIKVIERKNKPGYIEILKIKPE